MNMKKLSTKQLGILVGAVIVLGVGGTFAYTKNQSGVKIAEAKEQVNVSTNDLKKLNKEINALLDKKDNNYLDKSTTEKEIKAIKDRVKKATAIESSVDLPKNDYSDFNKEVKAVNESMTRVTRAYNVQTTINTLYQKTDKGQAINGSDVTKDLAIANDLKVETTEKAKKEFYTEGATSPYDKTINELISNAENQANQISKAKTAVAKVYKENKVISTDTKLYDTAKAETDKIKNEKAKKELLDQLAKVKADSDKQAKETADKVVQTEPTKATEQTNQAATAPANAQASNGNEGNATVADNGYAGTGGATGTDNGYTGGGGAVTPTTPEAPATNTGGGQASSSGGTGQGVMTQEQGNQAAADASQSDWSQFFPK